MIPVEASPTTEAPPPILNLSDNFSISDELYVELPRLNTAYHWPSGVRKHSKTDPKIVR